MPPLFGKLAVPIRRMTVALVLAALGGCAEPTSTGRQSGPVGAGEGENAIARVDLRLASGDSVLLVGEVTQASVAVFSASGAALSLRSITWRSTDSSIAHVGSGGRLEGRGVGRVDLVATINGTPHILSLRVAPGLTFPLAVATVAGSAPPPCRVIVSGPRGVDSTVLNGGLDVIQTRALPSDTLLITIQPLDESGPAYYPHHFAARIGRAGLEKILTYPLGLVPSLKTVLLVPTTWTIQQGIFAGRRVPVSLDVAMRQRVNGGNCNSYFCSFTTRGVYTVLVRAWLPSAFPIPTYMNHATSHRAIDPADSVLFWAALDEMERVFGRDLFRPVNQQDMPDFQARPNGLRVQIDTTIGNVATGGSTCPLVSRWGGWEPGGGGIPSYFTQGVHPFDVQKCHVLYNSAGPQPGFAGSGQITLGHKAYFRIPSLLQHEAMHVLGMGHTCEFPSIQGGYAYCGPSGPESIRLSEYDVAYTEWTWAIFAREEQLQTALGATTSWFGERRVTLGLPVIPDTLRTRSAVRSDVWTDMR